ncbi:MAG TPA: hypothetical protein VFQ76_03665, partial [Longimicrobiaceae bacterium]|nr:hypothetical protein [Longimicrobiaceae bacterium]
MSTLYVVAPSDSFSSLWPQLAADAGAEARVVPQAEDAESAPDALAVVLCVAGVEEKAEPAL